MKLFIENKFPDVDLWNKFKPDDLMYIIDQKNNFFNGTKLNVEEKLFIEKFDKQLTIIYENFVQKIPHRFLKFFNIDYEIFCKFIYKQSKNIETRRRG
uniref:Uncharacterized protein n=1 Tax=viral metagenome TaxID=1070528 RepID=A0A6C0JQ03_9ZZZZ